MQKEQHSTQQLQLLAQLQKDKTNVKNICKYADFLFKNNKIQQSLEYYTTASKYDNKSFDVWYGSAKIFQQLQQYDYALQFYLRAAQNIGEHKQQLYKILCNMGNINFRIRKIQSALNSYQLSLKMNPNYYQPYFRIGIMLKLTQQYQKAALYFQKCIQLNTDFEQGYFHLLQSYILLNNQENALKYYEIMKQKFAKYQNENIFTLFAQNYFKQGQYKKAQITFQYAIKVQPNNQSNYNNCGIACLLQNKNDKAIKYYQKAIQLNPKYRSAYNNLGNIYQQQKKFKEAMECFTKAMENDPTNIIAYQNIAIYHINQKQFQKGEQIIYKCIQNNENKQQELLLFLSYYYKFKNMFDKVQYFCKKVLQKYPKSQEGLRRMALLCLNQQRLDQSLQYNLRMLEVNNKAENGYNNVGKIYQDKKDYVNAQKYFVKALQISPLNILYIINRAQNLMNLNKVLQAFQMVQKVKQIMEIASQAQLMKQFKLQALQIKYINVLISYFDEIKNLFSQQWNMTKQDKQQTKSIRNSYFQCLQPKNMSQNKILQLQNKIKMLQNRMQANQKQVKIIKKQFQLDNRFQQLLQNKPQHAFYFRSLFSIICTSIQAYRSLQTGVVAKGGQILHSGKISKYVSKITKFLKIAQNIPMISSYCSIMVKIGQFYLDKSQQAVMNQIIQSTNTFYNERKLSKAVSETLIFLAGNNYFMKKLKQGNYNEAWYQRILRQVSHKVQKAIPQFKCFSAQQIQQDTNLALGHSAQILLSLINKQNKVIIKQQQNPLLAAAQIWMKQQQDLYEETISSMSQVGQRIVLIIKSAKLYQNKTSIGWMSPYCKITYGETTHITKTDRNGHQNPKWNSIGYIFKKLPFSQKINIQIYNKNILTKDNFIGVGKVSDTFDALKKLNSVYLFDKNKRVGELKIQFQEFCRRKY